MQFPEQRRLAAAAQAAGNNRLATCRGFGWSQEKSVSEAMERVRSFIEKQGGDLTEFAEHLKGIEQHDNEVF